MLAFSIGYEMAYSTVLDMMDIAGGIPIHSADRKTLLPLVIAGGTAALNLSLADFIDIFLLGEGGDE